MDFLLKKYKIPFILFCLYSVFLFLIAPFIFHYRFTSLLADTFNKVLVGTGALLAGIGGLRYLIDYIKKKTRREIIEEKKNLYRTLYPKELFGENKKFKVIQPESAPGTLYIAEYKKDKETPMSLTHIGNRWTYRDVYLYDLPVETIKDDIFKNTHKTDPILTRGEIGE